jgi:hypothetical protein
MSAVPAPEPGFDQRAAEDFADASARCSTTARWP